MPQRLRGCFPSRPERLATALHRTRRVQTLPSPPEHYDATGRVQDWDMCGNDQFGNCVFAEEANYKKTVSLGTGNPEIHVSRDTCIKDYLIYTGGRDCGANIDDALSYFHKTGLMDDDHVHRHVGHHGALDPRDLTELRHGVSLFRGVKLGVAGDLLERHVGTTNGWFIDRPGGGRLDHCVGLYAYGTVAYCLVLCGVNPRVADAYRHAPAFVLYTWATIGVITWTALRSIIGEAWVRITDPDRADSPVWDPIAQTDYAAVTD
jgi:hypothetical protein